MVKNLGTSLGHAALASLSVAIMALVTSTAAGQQIRQIAPMTSIGIQPGVLRVIPVKPEFKNVTLRGTAAQTNYNPIQFLTHPEVASSASDFDIHDFSPTNQRLFAILSRDIAANQANFNVQSLQNFINGMIQDSAHLDVEAMAQALMMQLAASASQDLRDMLNQVQEINKSKDALRKLEEKLKATELRCRQAPATCGEINLRDIQAAADKAKASLDSMSDLGETESMRLQQMMDRRAKLMETLANLLKKISDTSQTIVQNIK